MTGMTDARPVWTLLNMMVACGRGAPNWVRAAHRAAADVTCSGRTVPPVERIAARLNGTISSVVVSGIVLLNRAGTRSFVRRAK
jgi:hypothetical protein